MRHNPGDTWRKVIEMGLSKTEAAEYLGISLRSLERYTQKGKIAVKYVRGKYGKQPVYQRKDLEEFQQSYQEVVHQPAVANLTTQLSPPAQSDHVIELLRRFLAQDAQQKEDLNSPAVPIEHKLLLTIKEAQALTGRSWAFFREAIENGRLPVADVPARGFIIKRADLNKFIESIPILN